MSSGVTCNFILGEQLLYTYPWIYYVNFPEEFVSENPNIAKVLNKVHVTKTPCDNMAQLSSSAGQKYFSFAKCSHYDAGSNSVILCTDILILNSFLMRCI